MQTVRRPGCFGNLQPTTVGDRGTRVDGPDDCWLAVDGGGRRLTDAVPRGRIALDQDDDDVSATVFCRLTTPTRDWSRPHAKPPSMKFDVCPLIDHNYVIQRHFTIHSLHCSLLRQHGSGGILRRGCYTSAVGSWSANCVAQRGIARVSYAFTLRLPELAVQAVNYISLQQKLWNCVITVCINCVANERIILIAVWTYAWIRLHKQQ